MRLLHLKGIPLLLAVAGLAPLAHAHRAWMTPSESHLDDKEAVVSVNAAISEDLFETDSFTLQLDGLAITGPDGKPVAPDNVTKTRRLSSFDVKLAQPGTYRIANVSEQVMASYKLGGETKRFRGSAAELKAQLPADAQELQVSQMHNRVETFVSLGKDGGLAFTPTGRGLELVPTGGVTELVTGDTSRFQLLLDGQPAADTLVTLIRGGNRYRYKLGELTLKTDAQGRFEVKWPEAGRYWLSASWRPAAAQAAAAASNPPPLPSRRVSYTATLEVLPQ